MTRIFMPLTRSSTASRYNCTARTRSMRAEKPAGGVSTTPRLWDRRAIDAEWKNLTARLISQAKAPVVPLFFAGQNSRLFQIASHMNQTLRLSLIFKEVSNRIGTVLPIA